MGSPVHNYAGLSVAAVPATVASCHEIANTIISTHMCSTPSLPSVTSESASFTNTNNLKFSPDSVDLNVLKLIISQLVLESPEPLTPSLPSL